MPTRRKNPASNSSTIPARRGKPASSYLSSTDPRAHFGLGQAAEIDAIEVLWTDGTTERFPASPADRLMILRKGEGKIETP
ncbi:MAG: ASPIC/UnbV domain-containing protein [Chthoniobacteraceae bacterium]